LIYFIGLEQDNNFKVKKPLYYNSITVLSL